MLPRPPPQLLQSLRSFSTSASRHGGFISNVGKQPIQFPPSVVLTPTPTALSVKGPLGTTEVPLHPFLKLNFTEPQTLAVAVEDPTEKKQRSMWGLTRTLISNAIQGMTEGFTTPIYLVGVGYRAALEDDPRGKLPGFTGKRLAMKLGFSHSVYVPIPDYIKAEIETATKIVVSCTDKQKLGLFAAKVRSWRPPEPYKGKGIFVGNERVRRKTVKKK
ncbi:ribosomal protein L6 [Panus rudis PR-1116 ss-1]|nr:ribosomal protein L6 [Panus rudis PR-1116 ss-1]